MSREAILASYKTVLRATKVAFANDTVVLLAAREKLRNGFRQRAEDEKEIEQRLLHVQGIANVLNLNVVQGRKKEVGGGNELRYELNIHEKTELGDNETIKQKKSEMGSLAGVKATKRCS